MDWKRERKRERERERERETDRQTDRQTETVTETEREGMAEVMKLIDETLRYVQRNISSVFLFVLKPYRCPFSFQSYRINSEVCTKSLPVRGTGKQRNEKKGDQ